MEIGKNRESLFLFWLPLLFSVCVGIWSGIWKNEGSALSISLWFWCSLWDFETEPDKRWCGLVWERAQCCWNGVVPIFSSSASWEFLFLQRNSRFSVKTNCIGIYYYNNNKITVLPRYSQPRFKGGFLFFLLTVTNYNHPFT